MKRNATLSLIRLLATMFVIGCHLLEWTGSRLGYGKWVAATGNYLAVGVEIFLCLSGYLYGLKADKIFNTPEERMTFICKNVKKILFSCWLWIILVVWPVYTFLQPGSIYGFRYFTILLAQYCPLGVHHLWFIPYILFCYCITPALFDIRQYIEKKINTAIGMGLFLVCLTVLLEIVTYLFHGYFTVAYLFCYIIAFFMPALNRKRITIKKIFWISLPIAIIGSTCRFYLVYILAPQYSEPIMNFLNWCYIWSAAALGVCIFTGLVAYVKIQPAENTKIAKILKWSDKYSYEIYIGHNIYISGALTLMSITPYIGVNIAITILAIVISGVVLKQIGNSIKSFWSRMHKRKNKDGTEQS